MSSVIPGTSIVIPEPDGTFQNEGRGKLGDLRQGHVGPPLFAGREYDEGQSGEQYRPGPHNQAAARILDGVLRTLERKGLRETRLVFETMSGQIGAAGTAIIRLHQCPQGWETHLGSVTVDVPDSATITPSAPFANAAAFAFLSLAPSGGDVGVSALAAMRRGMVAFSPTSAGGPIIPGQWTFTSESAPVMFGGEELYYVLNGVAGLANLAAQVTVRAQMYGPA